ncbi:hypothetical protein HHI36_011677 [Cryptolaemus montrouzieri]|uniref:Uncharacterized protein n=1 Tax=Cryptolaemus montrouzieri TaxID=559131 RepID=A0ABD2MMJ0_9CUCU
MACILTFPVHEDNNINEARINVEESRQTQNFIGKEYSGAAADLLQGELRALTVNVCEEVETVERRVFFKVRGKNFGVLLIDALQFTDNNISKILSSFQVYGQGKRHKWGN